MQYFENVHGSKEMAIPLIKQKDTVYVKTNIHEETITDKTTGETRKEWVWNETQYTYLEYVQKQIALLESQKKALSDRNDFTDNCIAEMAMKIYA